jgi:hypothetical protein
MAKTDFHISIKDTTEKLKTSDREFMEFFKHGTLVVELYKPDKVDKQALI